MKKALLLLFSCLWMAALPSAFAQQRTLTGKVSDSDSNALPGASVRVKNTNTGVATDQMGAFSIAVPAEATTIVVSYTGFETREIEIGTSSFFDVQLRDGVLLRETVVTALGVTRSEKSLGYAVAQVDGSELTRTRDANIVNMLSGRAAGVQVVGSNGNLGSSSRITIRGIKSINGNNQPLFVVDGVPMDNSNFTNNDQIRGGSGGGTSPYDYGNAIQDLNPDDIEDISVLKGQAASALYGSRGVNGVIMVTTKKGAKSAKGIGVTVSSSLTFDRVAVFPEFQNRYGGGVELLPRGYSDNSGFYKVPIETLNDDGSVAESFASFDLVPIYAVDESNGTRFQTSTDEHFQNLENNWGYHFPNGYGTNEQNLHYRNWNSWDAWDIEHFGKNARWEVGDDPRDFFETGITSSHSVAFDGGGERSAFRLAYNRMDQAGIVPEARMNRNTLSFNGSLDLSSKLQVFTGVNYVKSATRGRNGSVYTNDGGTNSAQNFNQWWQTQLRFDDLKQYQNPDGSMRTWNRLGADNPRPLYWDNPYWTRAKNYQNDGRDRVFGNAGLTFKINSWLSLTGRVLNDFYTEQREERIADGSLLQPFYSTSLIRVRETNTDLIIRANRELGTNLMLDAFVGGNKLWRGTDRDDAQTVGGLNVPGIYRIQNSRERPKTTGFASRKQIESFFAGATLGWKNAVYLDLTGRQDWSSTLPDGSNGYFYPSVSASYVFSEMLDLPKMSFGKLRLGWASVGGDTDPYNIYTTYSYVNNFGSSPQYTVPDRLNNPSLKPERTNSLEAGLDLRFFRDRIGLDLTVYTGKTVDQIIPLSTSAASGYTQQFINAGEIQNKGIEIELSARPVVRGRFAWDVAFNFGRNRNKVVAILPDDPSIKSLPLADAIFGGASVHAMIGEPYGTILGTNYLFDKSGNRLIDPATGNYLVSGVMPIGNITPDFTGGLTNSFSWKGISLRVFVDFRRGGDIFSTTNMWGRYSGLFAETAVGDLRENGAVIPGNTAVTDGSGAPIQDGGADTETLLDDTYQSTGAANTQATDYFSWRFFNGGYVLNAVDVYDGSFVKLREMSVGYTLPKKWLSRCRIQELNISLVGRNLAILFKNVPHLDPDMAISTNNIQGLEGGATPTTRSVGINLGFRF